MIIPQSYRLAEVSSYYFALKLAEIQKLNLSGEEVINLGIGSPDLQPPPSVIRSLQMASTLPDANKYQSYRGIPKLREAWADWAYRNFETKINPDEEILPLLGSKEAIMHIHMSFLNPNDTVIIPDPGYPAYAATAKIAGANVKKYTLLESNNYLPDLVKLEQEDLSNVKIMWVNYPHMPTGAVASLELFRRLVSFAKKHKILLCHDNPYNFILNNNRLSIFQVDGAKDCALELHSLSKSHNMSGWRVGVLMGKKAYINTVLKFKSNMDSGQYKPIQIATIKALKVENSWFENQDKMYADKKKLVFEIMDLLGCIYDNNSAGLFVWGKAPAHVDKVEVWLNEILIEARVFITPGFIFGEAGSSYIRISLCSPKDVFLHALDRIKTYLDKQKKPICN